MHFLLVVKSWVERESDDLVAAIRYHSISVAEWSGEGLPIILVHRSLQSTNPAAGAIVHWSPHKQAIGACGSPGITFSLFPHQWLSVPSHQPPLLANPHQSLFHQAPITKGRLCFDFRSPCQLALILSELSLINERWGRGCREGRGVVGRYQEECSKVFPTSVQVYRKGQRNFREC